METQTHYSQVEITTAFKILHIEKSTMEDGAPKSLERFSYPPGADISNAHASIQEAAAEHWTQELIDAYQQKINNEMLMA
jgi:hypothetical protein